MNKITNKIIALVLILAFLLPGIASADDWFEKERGYYTILDEKGNELTIMAREIYPDDEYISGDNKHYIVTRVDKKDKKAYTKHVGTISLPTVELFEDSVPAADVSKGTVIIYTTHNSESYVPSDGTESREGKGGIQDVASAFKKNLEKKGINAVFDDAHHDPHDAGSYRRSRQTAVRLIKGNMPLMASFDIHRDAVPPEHYATKVDGQDMTKVRIVIGRRNQNRSANEELAYKVKSVGDKNYPGLIKDIFIGRGSYNQELTPRSLLFEMGSYENSKDGAIKSTAYLADLVTKLFAGGTSKKHTQSTGETKGPQTRVRPISQEKKTGGGRGILWLVLILAVGGVGFLFISTGSREMFSKRSSNRQDYSSFLGRKKRKKR